MVTESKKNPILLADLFAGIGGMRLGFEMTGIAVSAFASEWDSYACRTYTGNFNDEPRGDITEIPSEDIPQFDILLAGFPCQPFSIAGVSKKNSLNKPHGFKDKTQGNLFFEIARILEDKQPPAFLLENVKHLKRHDRGRTYSTIKSILEEDLNYNLHEAIIDARYVVPQHRERIFLVGFRDPIPFDFPDIPDRKPVLADILEKEVDPKYTLTDHLWQYLQDYAAKHKARGNGFGYGLADLKGVTRTLSARYYKDGSEILIPQKKKNPRRLTPRECARLMGFPDDFSIPVSDTRAYQQFGNSVAVPVVYEIAKQMIKALSRKKRSHAKTTSAKNSSHKKKAVQVGS